MNNHHIRALAMMLTCLNIAACDKPAEPAQPAEMQQPTSTAPVASDPGAMAWPAARSPLPDDPALERRVSDLLARMSDEEKVGQIIQAEIRHATPDDVRQYHLGSILNGGGAFPNGDKHATIDD